MIDSMKKAIPLACSTEHLRASTLKNIKPHFLKTKESREFKTKKNKIEKNEMES